MQYYISDLHLFHKNVTGEGSNFDNRPYATVAEMHSDIMARWNRKVTNGDTVYILGDMSMRGRQEDLIAYVAQLKGHKTLIRGNHDNVSDLRHSQLYEEICEYKEVRDRIGQDTIQLILCHYPILMWKNQHRGSILLYGHVHDGAEHRFFQRCINEMNREDFVGKIPNGRPLRAYNVGCMMPYMDYEPRTLEEIVGGRGVLASGPGHRGGHGGDDGQPGADG